MAKEYRTIRNDVALPYQWALGKTWTRFFDGLKEEKIWGTKCAQCGKVFSEEDKKKLGIEIQI